MTSGFNLSKFKKIAIETIGLQTPRGRWLFFVIVSIFVFFAPYEILANLSVWQRLGVPSPSIGLTRTYQKILHLNFQEAWAGNRLIFAVIFIGGIILIKDLFIIIKSRFSK